MNDAARYHSLDAIRGLAALAVLFGHAYGVLPAQLKTALGFLKMPPLLLFNNGRGAVMIFFVLSGFVLALSWREGSGVRYGEFVLRRFARIYLPFAAAVVFAAGLFAVTPHPSGTAVDWAARLWGGRVLSVETLAGHFAMTGIWDHIFLDSPMWSLVHEMRISLIFPLLVLLCARSARAAAVGAGFYIAGLFVASHDGNFTDYPIRTDAFFGTVAATVAIIPAFMAGILLARHRDAVLERLGSFPLPIRGVLWVAALGVFAALESFTYAPLMIPAAAALFSLTLTSPCARAFLQKAPLQWLGRISYSLYLIHVPVLLAVICAGREVAGYDVLITLSIFGSLLAAEIFYRLVERPSHILSRRIGGRTSA